MCIPETQTSDGRGTQPLDEVARQLLTRQVVDDMAARGLRCIGLAARDVPEPAGGAGGGGWPEGYWEEAPVEDMTLQVGACIMRVCMRVLVCAQRVAYARLAHAPH